MRNISFQLTTKQIRDRSKDVTRRLRWLKLKAGDRLQGCVKCMGLKPGEKIQKLAVIEVVSVKREPLTAIVGYPNDCEREGFPELSCSEFIGMFCNHMKAKPETVVARIEFKYV